MMIHDQLLSTQLLRDVKNEHSGFLETTTQALHAHNMPPLNMDLYSAYAFQAHIQQQQQHHQQQLLSQVPEVLDLSRRCDSVETSRKTPSPYHTNSSAAGTPPTLSPTSTKPYVLQQQLQSTSSPPPMYSHGSHQLPAALYPMLYFSNNITPPQVAVSTTTATASTITPPLTAAKAEVTTLKNDIPMTPDSSKSINLLSTTPKSSNSSSKNNLTNTQDVKNTRPFKAFPRDPLVIAANFAATDILLDNPRVERYTEYRKRVLEQIRNSNGGSRTITNPKMRRTSSRSNCISEAMATTNYNINNHSENDEGTVDESSDCDSNVGNFERMSSSMTSSTSSNEFNDANNNLHGTGGTVSTTSTNNKNGLDSNHSSHGQLKDAAYYERRRKNNAAAKKSRDRRRIKEDEIAIRAAYLERQNIELLCQIDALKAQLSAITSKVGA